MSKKKLPPSAHLDHLRAQSKALLRAARRGDRAALARFARWLPARGGGRLLLTQAQFVIACEYGFESWPRLRRHLQRAEPAPTEAAPEQAPLACFDLLWRAFDRLLWRQGANAGRQDGGLLEPAHVAALEAFVRDDEQRALRDSVPLVALRSGVLLPGATSLVRGSQRDEEELLAAVAACERPFVVLLAPLEPGVRPAELCLPATGVVARVAVESDAVTNRAPAIDAPELPAAMRPGIPLRALARARVEYLASETAIPLAWVSLVGERRADTALARALAQELRVTLLRGWNLLHQKDSRPRRRELLERIEAPGQLADVVAGWLQLRPDILAELLSVDDVEQRLRLVLRALDVALPMLARAAG